MNELNISIKDPYTNMESMPIFTNTEEENDYIYKPLICTEPFVLNIQKYACNNEKGYKFFTRPCICYRALPDDFEVHDDSLNEILYNKKHKNFMKKIIEGDYSLCKKCPAYKANYEGYTSWSTGLTILRHYGYYGKQIYNAVKNGKINKALEYPYCATVSLDTRCNLMCPTCRTHQVDNGGDITDNDFDKLVSFLEHCCCIAIGGDGETFLCKTYLKLLAHDFSNTSVEKIIIYTNGTLFNENAWNKIHPNNKKLISEIKISIDAVTKETYDKVRNGKYWDALMTNIDFLNNIPDKNFILQTTYTISKFNYKETLDFVDFAFSKGFEHILFSFARPMFHNNGNMPSDFILDAGTKNELTKLIDEVSKNKRDFEKDIFVGLI